jgi:hypothetical protein
MSIGLVSVPFLSMINFSNACGIGLNGASSMTTANTIRIAYGILSRIESMIFNRVVASKTLSLFQIKQC